ncbi:MAG: DUF4124 domain-containing protein, partial [Burkholderiaceae bacterium]|nr:DUF4124 domain-containing protein [Burkholderiaceae bacterium]
MQGTRLKILIALLLAPVLGAAQYKWTDADGRVSYGDSPPREARNIQRIDVRSDESGDELLRG